LGRAILRRAGAAVAALVAARAAVAVAAKPTAGTVVAPVAGLVVPAIAAGAAVAAGSTAIRAPRRVSSTGAVPAVTIFGGSHAYILPDGQRLMRRARETS